MSDRQSKDCPKRICLIQCDCGHTASRHRDGDNRWPCRTCRCREYRGSEVPCPHGWVAHLRRSGLDPTHDELVAAGEAV